MPYQGEFDNWIRCTTGDDQRGTNVRFLPERKAREKYQVFVEMEALCPNDCRCGGCKGEPFLNPAAMCTLARGIAEWAVDAGVPLRIGFDPLDVQCNQIKFDGQAWGKGVEGRMSISDGVLGVGKKIPKKRTMMTAAIGK